MAKFGAPIDPGIPGNYTLGKGRIFLAELNADDTPKAMRYVGNTPALSISIETENLDHFSSEAGVNVKDASVQTSITRTGTMTVDDIKPENLALFLSGDAMDFQQPAQGNNQTDTFEGVNPGDVLQLGATAANLAGVRDVTVSEIALPIQTGVVQRSVVAAGNYEIDAERGLVYVKANQGQANTNPILAGRTIEIIYTYGQNSWKRVKTGSKAVQRRLQFVSQNARGSDFIMISPKVALSASGDLGLKGDDWMSLDLALEILDPAGASEAIMIDYTTA